MTIAKARRTSQRIIQKTSGGFTLLELVIAITILASYLLPMLLILSKAKVRTIRTQQQRQLRDLAQRKLFDRIHYYEENNQGDFAAEGRPEWTWEVLLPEMVGNGDQVLLEYTVLVHTPQKIEPVGGGGGGGLRGGGGLDNAGSLRGALEILRENTSMSSSLGEEGSTFEMSVWAFPDDQWYLEQEEMANRGLSTELYGDPNYGR